MSAIEVEKLLQPLSEDSPCGEDLEYDPGFGDLERAAEGKPEQQMGDTVIPAEDPDWKAVRKQALALLERTRDLRVAAHLTQALVRTDGMPGLHDGLRLLHGLIDRHWEGVHPRLDPDDDNDPTMRVNVLVGLVDADRSLRGVREAILVESKGLGRFSYRDIQVATGQAPAPADGAPEIGAIDGAFLECPVEDLQAVSAAIVGAVEAVGAIETRLTEHVGTAQSVDLSALAKLLEEIGHAVAERLSRRGVGVAEGEAAGEAGGGGAAAPRAVTGEVTSREDVIRVLDKVCDFYLRHEPSSPIPLLLQRAKRLVSKEFMDVMRNVAPDAVAQVEALRGPLAEE